MTEPHDSAHRTPAGLRPPPRPRWVRWLLIAVAVAVLVYLGWHLVMLLAGGHGMGSMPGTHHGMSAPALVGRVCGGAA